MKKDWCTAFPEKWITWKGKVVDISECCKQHDSNCGTHSFAKCLRSKKVVGALVITLGGAIGCWVKYTKTMIKRI